LYVSPWSVLDPCSWRSFSRRCLLNLTRGQINKQNNIENKINISIYLFNQNNIIDNSGLGTKTVKLSSCNTQFPWDCYFNTETCSASCCLSHELLKVCSWENFICHGNLYSINWNPLKTKHSKYQLEFLLKKEKFPTFQMTTVPNDTMSHPTTPDPSPIPNILISVWVCVCVCTWLHVYIYTYTYVYNGGDVFPGPNELRTQPWKSLKGTKSLVPHPCFVMCRYRAPRHPFYMNVHGRQSPFWYKSGEKSLCKCGNRS
jgi:hypothetical protein